MGPLPFAKQGTAKRLHFVHFSQVRSLEGAFIPPPNIWGKKSKPQKWHSSRTPPSNARVAGEASQDQRGPVTCPGPHSLQVTELVFLRVLSDLTLKTPSENVPRIQWKGCSLNARALTESLWGWSLMDSGSLDVSVKLWYIPWAPTPSPRAADLVWAWGSQKKGQVSGVGVSCMGAGSAVPDAPAPGSMGRPGGLWALPLPPGYLLPFAVGLVFSVGFSASSQTPLGTLSFLKTAVICTGKCLRNKQINLTRIVLLDDYFQDRVLFLIWQFTGKCAVSPGCWLGGW